MPGEGDSELYSGLSCQNVTEQEDHRGIKEWEFCNGQGGLDFYSPKGL